MKKECSYCNQAATHEAGNGVIVCIVCLWPYEAGRKAGIAKGRAEAAAEIVAWLREEATNQLRDLGGLSDDIGIRACAESIEDGEHIAKAEGGAGEHVADIDQALVLYDKVNSPAHYAAGRNIEPIDAIEDWDLGFCLGNAVKYISRAGRKDDAREDLEKAIWYIQRYISQAVAP